MFLAPVVVALTTVRRSVVVHKGPTDKEMMMCVSHV